MGKIVEFTKNKGLENKFVEKFAKELAGELEGMGFEEGMELLNDVFRGVSYSDRVVEELPEFDGYKFRYECVIEASQMRDMEDEDGNECGICRVIYRYEINPTREEMIDYLMETGEYDEGFEEELDEEEFEDEFRMTMNDNAEEFEFDYLEGMFEDVSVIWDIVVDDDDHYYRGNDGILHQYWPFSS